MVDSSEQFRNIPAIRKMLADPMKTSRDMEDFYAQLTKKLNEVPASNSLSISNNNFSEMISDAISSNQRDYEIMGSNMEDLSDTLENIGTDIQFGMYDMIEEMQGVAQQMKIKNRIAKIRMNQNEATNEYLSSIDQGMSETHSKINETNKILDQFKTKLSDEFSQTKDYLLEMNAASDRIGTVSYGVNMPNQKSLKDLMENADFGGKKTLLALYAKNLINNDNDSQHAIYSTFSEDFLKYLNKNISSKEAKIICEKKKAKIQKLESEYSKQFNIGKKNKKNEDLIHEDLKRLQDKIYQAQEGLITDEEVELLDIYSEAKAANNILDLINMGFVEDDTLEKLLKNQNVDGEASLQIARIIKMDENGVNPKIDLDGDVGRRQQLKAQTIQGNIALNQRQAMLDGITEGNELTKITNEILLEVKNGLSEALYSIGSVLENIGNTIAQGFNNVSEELQNIRQVNKNILQELQQQTKILEEISKNMLLPLDIKANEFYSHGVLRAKIKERKNAFESFRKGLDEKSIHLGNLYGAGTAKMALGEDKEAAKYLLRAYKVAKNESKEKIVSSISLDIAKLNIKYLRLKLAKKRLNESIRTDKGNIESLLLKARVTKILGQKKEFKELVQIIYNEIIYDSGNKNIPSNYTDIFKYFYKPIDIFTQEEITTGGTSKLIEILPRVEKVGYINGVKNILSELLEKNPLGLKKAGIDTQKMLQKDKSFFNEKYKEIAFKEYIGGASIHLFALAHIGYQYVDSTIINQIIDTGMNFDTDYINLKNESDIQKKKMYIKNIKDKIYLLGDNAKYMLRDYLVNTPDSLLNI